MDTLGLKYFISAAKYLSFSKAAIENFVTQPVISRRIRELEQEFGCIFFERSSQGVRLTPAGEYFLSCALRMVQEYEDIKSGMKAFSGIESNTLSIAAPLPATYNFLPTIVENLKEENPGLEIIIDRVTPAKMPETMAEGAHDFYFCLSSDLKMFPHYHYSQTIQKDYIHLWTRKQDMPHNMAEALYVLKHNTVYILCKEDSPYTSGLIRKLLYELAVPSSQIKEVRPMESLLYYVSSGLGVAVMPYMNYYLNAYKLDVFQISEKYVVELILAWQKLTPNAQKFLEIFETFNFKSHSPN